MKVVQGERPKFNQDQIKALSGRDSIGESLHSAEEVYEGCKDFMEQVVDMFYTAYCEYVEKSDLYSQACLTMMTAYNNGVFTSGKNALNHFGKDLIMDMHLYCIKEMEEKSESVNVRNQELILHAMQARSAQESIENTLISIIDELPARQREVLLSYYANGENLAAVTRDTGLTRDIARSKLLYGMYKLRAPKNYFRLQELLSAIDSGVSTGIV